MKKEWQIWDALVRGQTRLGWNVERQTIEAANEWWEAKLQVGYLNSSYFKFNSCIKFYVANSKIIIIETPRSYKISD